MKCLQCGNNFDHYRCEHCPSCGANKDAMVEQNKIATLNWIENYTSTFVRNPNSQVLSPGKYVFGIDLPLGAYLLRVIKGSGKVEVKRKLEKREDPDFDNGHESHYIGLTIGHDGLLDDRPLEYRVHGLHEKEWFTIATDLTCEISKADVISLF